MQASALLVAAAKKAALLAGALLVLLLALWGLWRWIGPRPGPPAPPHVVVRETVTVDRWRVAKPDTVQTIVERILYKTVPPETILVTEPGKLDTVRVRFCDSTAAPSLLLAAGRVGPRRTQLWGVTSTGRGWTGVYPASPTFTFTVAADSVLVRETRVRLGWLVPTPRDLIVLLLGGAGGYAIAH
jgi:hypothetical protein